jgi:hypothetical protein
MAVRYSHLSADFQFEVWSGLLPSLPKTLQNSQATPLPTLARICKLRLNRRMFSKSFSCKMM